MQAIWTKSQKLSLELARLSISLSKTGKKILFSWIAESHFMSLNILNIIQLI